MRNLLVLALIAAVAACNDHDHDDHGDGCGHGHSHEAPNGGHLMGLGKGHGAHIEVKIDHDAGKVMLWVYDGDVKETKADAPPTLRFMGAEKPVSVVATGSGHAWTFTHDALKGEPKEARFQIAVGGKTYTPEWHHDHDHDH